MKNFNVTTAKSIVKPIVEAELHNILIDIKTEAERGKYYMLVESLNPSVMYELRSKGFYVKEEQRLIEDKRCLFKRVIFPKRLEELIEDYFSIHWK